MRPPFASFVALTPRKAASIRALVLRRSTRTPRAPGPLWLAVAAGSVALLLIAAHRRRRPESAPGARAPRPGPAERRRAPALDFDRHRAPMRLPSPRPPSLTAAPERWEVPRYSFDAPRPGPVEPPPGARRSALAIGLGQPEELRRLALEFEQTNQEAEAGLLRNYALLLERTGANPQRVMTEVTRMLRAAATARKNTRQAPLTAPTNPPATASAPRARPIIPLPTRTIGFRRRATP